MATATALELLGELERAYGGLFRALSLPSPREDWGLGGSDAVDVYLSASGEEGLRISVDEAPPRRLFDSASGACWMSVGAAESSARRAHQCLVELALLGLDPGEPPALRRALATQLWWALGTPESADLEAVDARQRAPEHSLAPRECAADERCDGDALMFEFLEQRRGTTDPGGVGFALFAAAASQTPADSWQWKNEPDLFDVLRHTVGESKRAAAELALSLAVTRAFLGDRGEGTQLPTLGWAGSFGRPRIDWSLRASTLPRRVAASRPIEPFGAYYLWLELDSPKPTLELGFRAEWEEPAAFAWTLLSVAEDGQLLARHDVPFQQSASLAESSWTRTEGAGFLLVVGTTLEGIAASHPFDPDVWPYEPRGLTVYLSPLDPE